MRRPTTSWRSIRASAGSRSPSTRCRARQVRVSYAYGFSDAIGGGEYQRTISQPAGRTVYTVGERGQFHTVADALAAWQQAEPQPRDAVVEITDSAAYVEQISVTLAAEQSLQIRAANRTRPVIRLLDWQTDLPDALTVRMNRGSRFTLDGVMVTGRGLTLYGPDTDAKARAISICDAQVRIRHSTLVPGWNLAATASRPVRTRKASRSGTSGPASRSRRACSARSKCRKTRCTRRRSRSRSPTASSTPWTATARRSSARTAGTPMSRSRSGGRPSSESSRSMRSSWPRTASSSIACT